MIIKYDAILGASIEYDDEEVVDCVDYIESEMYEELVDGDDDEE